MKYLGVGDKVLVHIPLEDRVSHASIMKYNDKKMIVARRTILGKTQSNYVYYELAGAESEYHIPYGFIREWLVLL